MVPNPVGAPLAAGANCEALRHGVFTAPAPQEPGIRATGVAKIGPSKFKPASGASALVSTMLKGRPVRQNQLLARVQPLKTRFGPQWNPAWRNTSLNTMLA